MTNSPEHLASWSRFNRLHEANCSRAFGFMKPSAPEQLASLKLRPSVPEHLASWSQTLRSVRPHEGKHSVAFGHMKPSVLERLASWRQVFQNTWFHEAGLTNFMKPNAPEHLASWSQFNQIQGILKPVKPASCSLTYDYCDRMTHLWDFNISTFKMYWNEE